MNSTNEEVRPMIPSSIGIVSKQKGSTCRLRTKSLVILLGVTSFLLFGLAQHYDFDFKLPNESETDNKVSGMHGGEDNNAQIDEAIINDTDNSFDHDEDDDDDHDHHDYDSADENDLSRTADPDESIVAAQQKPRPRHKLIDFVIAGFPKCGTTTMLNRLNENPQVYMGGPDARKRKPVDERHELRQNKGHRFQDFFDRYSMEKINSDTHLIGSGGKVLKQVVGFKSPEVVRSETFLPNVVELFPAIDMIVSVRHPVLHFESNYNFRLRNADPDEGLELVDTKDLIGDCWIDCQHSSDNHICTPKHHFLNKRTHLHDANGDACTGTSTFHHALSRLALTPMEEPRELGLLDHHQMSVQSEWSGRLLLMEIGQISDKDAKRHDKFERRFEDFLGLEANSFTTDETEEEKAKYQQSHKFIHICDEEHREVRESLVDIGLKGSTWIKDYLLKSDRVEVANKDHFLELIEKWGDDPCKK
uniref:Sulfotransferase domain-containing protein n=1 Tax=Chaetoceros debilis TaxID=122233 RepID=A0A7S3Q594_9STRA